MPDLWSLVTGLASLISLIISVNEKFINLRKYSYPTAAGFAGFAIGRLSPAISSEQDSIFILIVFSYLLVLGIVSFFLFKREQTNLIPMVIIITLLIALPRTTEIYLNSNSAIPKTDILELAKLKESKGNIDASIQYYQMYKKTSNDSVLQEEINKRIDSLKLKIVN